MDSTIRSPSGSLIEIYERVPNLGKMQTSRISRTSLFAIALLVCGCETGGSNRMSIKTTERALKSIQKIQIKTTAFANGGEIPGKYAGDGSNFSPRLGWSLVPSATESFAIICEDPDAPSRAKPRTEGPWVHWIIFNIPAMAREVPEALPRTSRLTNSIEALQGKNDYASDNIGYRGPMPPKGSGPHRYFFKLYALDCTLDLDPNQANKGVLMSAMQGHIVGEAECMGTYERK
jgi:Raf kinase inhibitor-like YbhB/YbcL family protein